MTALFTAVGCVLYVALGVHLYRLGRTVAATLVFGMALGLAMRSGLWGWVL
ncbi:hypothetical protein ACIGW3_26200 [Streptomyces sp. NPDC053499]|uniref:hypothetical protein n=1 Tax=Streptomyces sp. NPDC053499 TaxID=3365707 RepID=UPI0037D55115